MFWIFFLRIAGLCLGWHSLFDDGMLLQRLGDHLQQWAAQPLEKKKQKLMNELSGGTIRPDQYAVSMAVLQYSRTVRQILLKPLYSCVGCTSGPIGVTVFLLSAVGSPDWTGYIERYWLDGLAAIFACVFFNRLAWSLWERLKNVSP